MIQFWHEMGFIRYPLLIVAIFMAVQSARAIFDLRGTTEAAAGELRVHTILLWGVLGAAIGALGTLVGMMLAATAVERAGTVDPQLVWGGFRVTLGSSIVGLLLLGYAAIAWLVLQHARALRFRAES
jgi:hypothetical protein